MSHYPPKAIRLDGMGDLQTYLDKIEERLKHHGEGLRPLVSVLTMCGLRAIDYRRPVHARTYRGETANQIWFFTKSGRELKITYHPTAGVISVCDAETRDTLAEFTRDSDLADVANTMAGIINKALVAA